MTLCAAENEGPEQFRTWVPTVASSVADGLLDPRHEQLVQ
jgi:hypothetical protein